MRSMQEKLESARVGRLLISVFVAVTVGALVVWNMPGSKLKLEGLRVAGPYVRATGLDQNWAVFAPNPVRDSFYLTARVTYADGTHSRWEAPTGGALVGAYWDFRWGKWSEWTTQQSNPALCPATATWIANREADDGKQPVRVDVLARRRVNQRPGVEPPHAAWQETLDCRVRITGADAP